MNRQSEKDPRRQLQGYTSKKKGQAFEAIIAAACRAYRVERIAYIDKTPEPMRVIGRGQKGQFTAIFEKKAQPDFKGTLSGGRAVCFEAKNKEGDRVNQTAVTQEQKEALNDHADLDFENKICPQGCRFKHFRILPVEGAPKDRFFCTLYQKQLRKRFIKGYDRVYKCTECQYEL